MRLTSSTLEMSAGTAIESGNSRASRSSLSFERATKANLAPLPESSFAVANPMPSDAPVTIATLPLTFNEIAYSTRLRISAGRFDGAFGKPPFG